MNIPGKIFPKAKAKKDSFLKALLIKYLCDWTVMDCSSPAEYGGANAKVTFKLSVSGLILQ